MLIILGATGGLGKGLLELAEVQTSKDHWDFGEVIGTSRKDIDLTDEQSVARFVSGLQLKLKPKEVIKVVNATGISINGMMHKFSNDDFEKTLRTNVSGNFLFLKYLQPIIRDRPGSSMVILSSVVGETGVIGTIAYATSKSALRGLCRVSAKELARFDVTVNVIELGYFEAGMILQVPTNIQESLRGEIPLNRFGKISELFSTCKFALECGYLTGSTIKLNGGLT